MLPYPQNFCKGMKMTELSLSEIEKQRFNPWCLRRPLLVSHPSNWDFLKRKDLLPVEEAFFYFHENTNCKGIEFVVFSSARIPKPVFLPKQIVLVPCFTVTEAGPVDMNMRDINSRMSSNGRFIYDGWMPIKTWDDNHVSDAVRTIEEILSIFCIQGPSAVWEPKYHPMRQSDGFLPIDDKHLHGHAELFGVIDALEGKDRIAFFKSLGWVSQGLQATRPAAKLLFFFLAIESLATYIEKHAPEGSSLRSHRSITISKSQKEDCIRVIMEQTLDSDPVEAVRSAYFDCVRSISKMLKSHVEHVMPDESQVPALIFKKKGEDAALYTYRHKIAHGGLDALSEKETENVRRRLWDAESAARAYLFRILYLEVGSSYVLQQVLQQTESESLLTTDPKLASKIGEQDKRHHMGLIYNLPFPQRC